MDEGCGDHKYFTPQGVEKVRHMDSKRASPAPSKFSLEELLDFAIPCYGGLQDLHTSLRSLCGSPAHPV